MHLHGYRYKPDRPPFVLPLSPEKLYSPRQKVSFDPRSRFAHPGDQLILSWRMPRGSRGHRRLCPFPSQGSNDGGDGSDEAKQSWPGVGGEPPLVVMADSLTVRSVSASAAAASPSGSGSGADEEKSGVGGGGHAARAWGFLLTARGREVGEGREAILFFFFCFFGPPWDGWMGKNESLSSLLVQTSILCCVVRCTGLALSHCYVEHKRLCLPARCCLVWIYNMMPISSGVESGGVLGGA